MMRSAFPACGGASAARPLKYAATWWRYTVPCFLKALRLPCALAGTLMFLPRFRKSAQKFPVSLRTLLNGAGGTLVATAVGTAVGTLPDELVEAPLQPASVTHVPATAVMR